MVEHSGTDYHSQQHFITNSPWDAFEAMQIVAKKTNEALGDKNDQVLNFD